MSHVILGLDVGGANLKTALSNGAARSRPFALWKQPLQLADELGVLISDLEYDRIALTMTGELCDCFATKRAGVQHIIDAVAAIAEGRPIHLWSIVGRFVPVRETSDLLEFAASNWLALATFAGRLAPTGDAVLIDVGSTTTDIIPLCDGRPIPIGRTDSERLASGELIYTGVRRTPLCALIGFEGMAEFFATTHDVYVLLGHLPEDATDCDTADGRPATREFAHARLARMLGGDGELTAVETTLQLAKRIRDIQVQRISAAVERHDSAATYIVSGSGEFLARMACGEQRPVISLTQRLGANIAVAACAYAVAKLAQEQL